MIFVFQEDCENSKGQMRGLPKHVDRDAQKSVQIYAKINEHNFITRGANPTTLCIRGICNC